MVGKLAVSCAGHDKGTYYLIIKEEGDRVYAADGAAKRCGAPKKKNKKHIRLLAAGPGEAELRALLANPETADAAVRRWIKQYLKENGAEAV